MKTKALLIEIIEKIDLFEKENSHLDDFRVEDFVNYLASNLPQNPPKPDTRSDTQRHVLLSQNIGLFYRYSREYIKKALAGSALNTAEEFSFLVVLMKNSPLSKTELIQKNALPKTSGTEIIKRLLKKGLLKQSLDKNDKRSQQVALSAKGMKEMKHILPKMQLVSQILTGNLSTIEQDTLIYLLQRLDTFHEKIFLNDMGKSLEELASGAW